MSRVSLKQPIKQSDDDLSFESLKRMERLHEDVSSLFTNYDYVETLYLTHLDSNPLERITLLNKTLNKMLGGMPLPDSPQRTEIMHILELETAQKPNFFSMMFGSDYKKEYFVVKRNVQNKIRALSDFFQRRYRFPPLFPCTSDIQFKELEHILLNYLLLSDLDKVNTNKLVGYLPEKDVSLRVDESICVYSNNHRTGSKKLASWLHEQAKAGRSLEEIEHFAACHVYNLFIGKIENSHYRDLQEMMRIASGMTLIYHMNKLVLYQRLPDGFVDTIPDSVMYKIPEAKEYDTDHSENHVHLLSWLKNQLHERWSLRELEYVLGAFEVSKNLFEQRESRRTSEIYTLLDILTSGQGIVAVINRLDSIIPEKVLFYFSPKGYSSRQFIEYLATVLFNALAQNTEVIRTVIGIVGNLSWNYSLPLLHAGTWDALNHLVLINQNNSDVVSEVNGAICKISNALASIGHYRDVVGVLEGGNSVARNGILAICNHPEGIACTHIFQSLQ